MKIEAIIPDSQYKRRLGENKEMRYEAGISSLGDHKAFWIKNIGHISDNFYTV
jgi:hypothetical protein